MPGLDRTGPQGVGPMTGGRRGFCGSPRMGAAGGVGYGGGRRWGRGCGFGRNYGWAPPAYEGGYSPATGDERAALKDEVESLRNTLDAVQRRIVALENASD